MILLDANILVRLADRNDPKHALTLQAILTWRRTDSLLIVPQSLYEFAAVATRAVENNGLGMDNERAARWLARCRRMFQFLPDPPDLCDRWQTVVSKYVVRGFRVHDARYVAAMQALGVDQLMTHNARHFADFPIRVIDPGA